MFSSVRETFKGLRAAFPNATIVAFGYPSVIDDPSHECAAAFRIGADELAWLKGTVMPTVNDAIKDAASEAGVIYADISAATAGHGICSAEPWINGLRRGTTYSESSPTSPFTRIRRPTTRSLRTSSTTSPMGAATCWCAIPTPLLRSGRRPGRQIRLGSIDVGAAKNCGADCLQPAACIQTCKVHVQGAGFDPGVAMGATLQSDPVSLGSVVADPSGHVDAWFQLPPGLEPGLHSVTLDGLALDGTREHAVKGFQLFTRVPSRIRAKFQVGKQGTLLRALTVKRASRGHPRRYRLRARAEGSREGVRPWPRKAPWRLPVSPTGRSMSPGPPADTKDAPAGRRKGGHRHHGQARGQYGRYFSAPLAAGTVIRVVVTRREQGGRTLDARVRAGKKPKLVRSCTEPGSRAPTHC